VVFVPEEAADGLRFALGEAGAGWTGGYSHCSFRTTGEGTFLPREGTSPYIGEQGELTEVAEHRLETIVTSDCLPAVLEAVKKNHPYEEPAYDIYRLENQGEAWGFGRIGELECAVNLAAFARSVEAALDSEVEVLGCLEESVQRVAVCGGAGADFIDSAISQGAAVYVTGDVKYHEAQEAQAAGLALIDGGHAATEAPVVESLAEYLREQLPADCTIAAHPHSTVKWKGVE
jgi:hypothetical protein